MKKKSFLFTVSSYIFFLFQIETFFLQYVAVIAQSRPVSAATHSRLFVDNFPKLILDACAYKNDVENYAFSIAKNLC